MGKVFMLALFTVGLVVIVGCLLMGVTVLINFIIVPLGLTAFTMKQTVSFLTLLLIVKELLK